MAQIFPYSSNVLSKVLVAGGVLFLAGAATAGGLLFRSPYNTEVNVSVKQVVPFSHEHHVAGLGIDCRYCHTSVETSSFAGIPPTHTCMTCHSQVWNDAPILEPVRKSYRDNTPLVWNRVHDLPQFVYFNHAIHVAKGIGCVSCHGRVDQMPLMRKANTMFMTWCLDCHRDPAKYIRPKDRVFDMTWQPGASTTAGDGHGDAMGQHELGQQLVKENDIKVEQLINCSVCHR